MYIENPEMNTSAAEQMESKLYSNSISPEIGLIKITDASLNTVKIDRNETQNSVLVDQVRLAPSLTNTKKLVDNGKKVQKKNYKLMVWYGTYNPTTRCDET